MVSKEERREYWRQRRASETPEERQFRLERQAIIRHNETPHQRKSRLKYVREYAQQKRDEAKTRFEASLLLSSDDLVVY